MMKGTVNGEGRTMTRNYETICDPPPWATAVGGFSFRHDQNGRTIARCVRCCAGYALTEHRRGPGWGFLPTWARLPGDVGFAEAPPLNLCKHRRIVP